MVFHPASGDVHLLSAAGAELLRALASEPMDFEALIRLMSLPESEGEAPDLRRHLASTLDAFDRAGLIEPVRP